MTRREARIRLIEMIALPVHAWPDDGKTYPQSFGTELVRYRNRRIRELEEILRRPKLLTRIWNRLTSRASAGTQ